MIKKLKEEALIKYSGAQKFADYVQENQLEDEVVDSLIKKHREDLLCEYIRYQPLNEKQVTCILRAPAGNLMRAVLRRYVLTEEQQMLLLECNNILLLETYLMPKCMFDVSRRFSTKPERLYIQKMLNNKTNLGIELFKVYIDNNYRDILTYQVLDDVMAVSGPLALYLLKKGFFTRDKEEYLISKAPKELINQLIHERTLRFDSGIIVLIDRFFELAKEYFAMYGMPDKSREYYHNVRSSRIGKSKIATEKT